MNDKQYYITKLQAQKEILEQKGHKVAYICVYGSDNYGLNLNTDEYKSDIDMKAIIIPTLNDLIYNCKPISMTIDTEWGSVDVKDIRIFIETLLKANPAYVETLFTDYYVIDCDFSVEMQSILQRRDKLVDVLQYSMLRAMYGMSLEKENALCHPYPSIKNKIDRYGFDGKQISHAYRLNLMIKDYFLNGKPFKECLLPPEDEINKLLDYKLNKVSLETAINDCREIVAESKTIKDNILANIDENKIDYSIKDEIINISRAIIKNKIVEEVKELYG